MCAACVAQGAAYVGASLAGLRVMAARSKVTRAARKHEAGPADDERTPDEPAEREPVRV
jgi:hypothetical protein